MTQKLYLNDSYLLEANALVLEVTRTSGGCDVVLDRTVLFPTSGGQPCDRGWIANEPVLDVRLEGTRVVHRTTSPPPAGIVLCKVDPVVRLDHMQQHSGQHLLSRVFVEKLGVPTVSFHLGVQTSTIDLVGGQMDARPLDEAGLAAVEAAANEIVRTGHAIRVAAPTSVEMAAAPPDLQALSAGELRIVDMHGVDRSFCCGTHLRSTAEIGPIKILGSERKGPMLRVEFMCGGRTLAHHDRLHRVMTQLTQISSARPEELGTYLTGVLQDREVRGRQIRTLQAELAATRAELMASRAPRVGNWPLVRLIQNGGTAEELRLLGEELSTHQGCVFVGGHRPDAGEKGTLVIGVPTGAGLHAGKLLGEVLSQFGGRGGGRPELAQGGAPVARMEQAVEKAVAEVSARLQHPGPGF